MASRPIVLATVIACIAYFAYGVVEAVVSGTLLDLAEIASTSVQFVNNGSAIGTLVYCISCLFCGFLLDRLDHRTISISCMLAVAASTFTIPMITCDDLLLFNFIVTGFARGGLDVGVNTWMLTMWGKKSNTFMLAMHSCYTLAFTITPMLLPPFLSQQPDPKTGFSGRQSTIWIPYTVASVLCILPIFLIFCHRLIYRSGVQSDPCPESVISGDKESSDGPMFEQTGWKRVAVTLLACCSMAFYSGMDLVFLTLLPQFAVFSELHLSKATGVHMLSSAVACTGVVKSMSALLATRVSAKAMIISDLSLMWMGHLMMSLFANRSETVMWTSALLVGIGVGSCFPALLSFMGQEISSSGWTTGCMMAAGRVTSVPMTLVISAFLEQSAIVFAYSNLTSVSIAGISFAGLLLFAK